MTNKQREYWEKRDAAYLKVLAQAERELGEQYRKCFKRTYRDLLELYDEIQNSDEVLVSDLYKFDKFYKLLNDLNANLKKLGLEEQKINKKALQKEYEKTIKVVGNEIGFEAVVDDNKVETAISSIWCKDGKHWSSRIWKNKSALEEKIKDGLVDTIIRGTPRAELSKTLQALFNVGFAAADRITRTELAYIQIKASCDEYADAGVDKYEILFTDDNRTCKECKEMNGKQFLLKDGRVGENLPPLHVNCRCCILVVL